MSPRPSFRILNSTNHGEECLWHWTRSPPIATISFCASAGEVAAGCLYRAQPILHFIEIHSCDLLQHGQSFFNESFTPLERIASGLYILMSHDEVLRD